MKRLASIINQFYIVKKIPIFNNLKWFQLTSIARKSIIVECQKGDLIRQQGDPADALYCLVSGRIQSYRVNAEDKKENVEFIHRGMHFGIISLFTGESHSLNYVAINDSVILKIQKDDFLAILKDIPQLGLVFTESLSKRIRSNVTQTKTNFESTIISIYSSVKGSGSSTYAVNLALTLQKETKKKVVFVTIQSLNHQPDDPSNRANNTSLKAIQLKDIVNNHERILESISREDIGIDFLSVVFDLKDAIVINQIGSFVGSLVYDYQYVVVDLPNEMDNVVLKTLTQSDLIHLLTMDFAKDLQMTRKVIDQLQQELKGNFKEEKVQVIISGLQDQTYLPIEEINKEIDFDIYTKLPFIDPSQIRSVAVSHGFKVITVEPASEYSRAITKIARQIGGVRIGLVLGGGAALGVAHIGVIKVLEEEKIPVDIVIGSSMGALIASLWATGRKAKDLEMVAREFQKKWTLIKLMDPILPISGLIGGRAINQWLKKHLGLATFYNTFIPLKIVAYDLIRREELILDSGSLVEAVRKSVSIPGVMRPVLEKGRMIIDGGVLNPLPTNVLVDMGIKKIIAVNVLQSPGDVTQSVEAMLKREQELEKISLGKSPLQYLSYRSQRLLGRLLTPNISDIIVRTLQATEYIIAQTCSSQANVFIQPDLRGINWFELYKVDELLKKGEEAARLRLLDIKRLMGE